MYVRYRYEENPYAIHLTSLRPTTSFTMMNGVAYNNYSSGSPSCLAASTYHLLLLNRVYVCLFTTYHTKQRDTSDSQKIDTLYS